MTKYYYSYLKHQKEHINPTQEPRRYAIVDFSSMLSELKMQRLATYCGTKRFNEVFTQMSTFYIKKGQTFYKEGGSCLNMVDNLVVKPSRVSTGMNQY